ncbi:uncharacterized protein LOC100575137 [Acyrthosiphon pisum]|uniref:Uncharacterized protein n=1 Tax=Acyrthosiphon pisum TaxID=7029 RepID=A0A8R2D402_ACYPI|nr:uncharacterized protein LOC100575137 [Acyrthosiphon pisum]|eukprot:XP_016659683.1 PREDICTED: uncharacterized protein LOC100575137 [Acyrthosiphon pisum]
MSTNEVPVLSTCEDQFISPIENEAAEKSLSDKNNLKDNTDNTSMIIDLTIDDSSNSPLSITLEPIEKRKTAMLKIFQGMQTGLFLNCLRKLYFLVYIGRVNILIHKTQQSFMNETLMMKLSR